MREKFAEWMERDSLECPECGAQVANTEAKQKHANWHKHLPIQSMFGIQL